MVSFNAKMKVGWKSLNSQRQTENCSKNPNFSKKSGLFEKSKKEKNPGFSKNGLFKKKKSFYFLPFMGQKVVFWVTKRCFGVFWTECEVADLKQRQRTTAMDHRNKIQSLVLPTDDPGDAPNCICEYGPCICEYGRMCHTAPTSSK